VHAVVVIAITAADATAAAVTAVSVAATTADTSLPKHNPARPTVKRVFFLSRHLHHHKSRRRSSTHITRLRLLAA
jgi:hypothetical protein